MRKRKKLSRQGSQATRRRGFKLQPRQLFADGHPQSQTHLQVIRTESLVPSLSLLPPRENSNREKFQICMLILFKPFFNFACLYNGISWEGNYLNTDFRRYFQHIKNLQEMHIGPKENDNCTHNSGIQHNDDAGLDSDDENVNFLCEEVDNDDTVQL